jgi:hypothetical protein
MHFRNYFSYHLFRHTYVSTRAIRVPYLPLSLLSQALMDLVMNSSWPHSLQRVR